jgi:hypothetical protein
MDHLAVIEALAQFALSSIESHIKTVQLLERNATRKEIEYFIEMITKTIESFLEKIEERLERETEAQGENALNLIAELLAAAREGRIEHGDNIKQEELVELFTTMHTKGTRVLSEREDAQLRAICNVFTDLAYRIREIKKRLAASR